jgi:flagellin-like protein
MMKGVNPLVASILLISFVIAVAMIVIMWWENYNISTFTSYTTAICNEDCSKLQDIHIICIGEGKILDMRTVGNPVPNTLNRTPDSDFCR